MLYITGSIIIYIYMHVAIIITMSVLLHREMVASLSLLADMTAQAKAIEILIFHVSDVSTNRWVM